MSQLFRVGLKTGKQLISGKDGDADEWEVEHSFPGSHRMGTAGGHPLPRTGVTPLSSPPLYTQLLPPPYVPACQPCSYNCWGCVFSLLPRALSGSSTQRGLLK
ncbi:hypothetical protein JOB18_024245 [Solea senegalensis]|uniref:Uncharacterized protein n=1 Tax=Solea senegalensis TaxID=28829 RepID=A0AAV6Q3W3_SOLSE|nr:hypothetical protein JOB18_024245 [Solea senegalensis]